MYKIILYNSGRRIKQSKFYWKYGDAIRKYNQLLEENQVYFPKKIMQDGSPADYELGLIGPAEGKSVDYIRNNIGALVKVKPKGDFILKKITPFEVEEEFLYKNTDKIYTFKEFVKDFLVNEKTNVIYTLNNKLIIEFFESEDIHMFVLKTNDESIRLNDLIRDFAYSNDLTNFIFFTEPTKENKIRLYDKLVDKLKIDRDYLQRVTTL